MCTKCGAKSERKIISSALGHDFIEPAVLEDKMIADLSNCTQPKYYKVCSRCEIVSNSKDDTFVATEKAKAHSYAYAIHSVDDVSHIYIEHCTNDSCTYAAMIEHPHYTKMTWDNEKGLTVDCYECDYNKTWYMCSSIEDYFYEGETCIGEAKGNLLVEDLTLEYLKVGRIFKNEYLAWIEAFGNKTGLLTMRYSQYMADYDILFKINHAIEINEIFKYYRDNNKTIREIQNIAMAKMGLYGTAASNMSELLDDYCK